MDKARECKLPQWAQAELIGLRKRVSVLELHTRILKTEGTGTGLINVSMDNYQTPLPDRARISFFAGTYRIELFVDSDGVLRLYSRGRLVVEPQSTNALHLKSK